MVTVRGPLLSITARGWLGRYTYAVKGLVKNPYPIALLGKIRIPYSLWDRNIHGFYKVPAWALRPYPGWISRYYSRLGWCYQLRRTWHGIVWSATRPPISKQPNTAIQYAYKQIFAQAVHIWQGMDQEIKDVYNRWRYPVRASGYNRWLHWFLKERLIGVYLLAEDGDYILLENSGRIILE